jgi:hypothetical protein
MQTATTESHGIITSDTVLIHDRWLHRWQGTPPREFCLGKVLFHSGTPAEIAVRGWQVVEPAVSELATGLHLEREAVRIDWLKLDQVRRQECLIGVHADETVVAAAPLSSLRRPFIPYRFYELLAGEPQWRNLRYYGSYRHFIAGFDTGSSFFTETCRLLCDVEYHVHFGVHGVHSLWAAVRIGDRTIAVPRQLRISGSLQDLPGKVDCVTRFAREFVGRLGTAWLAIEDEMEMWELACSYMEQVSAPAYRINELKTDPERKKLFTKLDMLLYLSKAFSGDAMTSSSNLLKLARLFLSPTAGCTGKPCAGQNRTNPHVEKSPMTVLEQNKVFTPHPVVKPARHFNPEQGMTSSRTTAKKVKPLAPPPKAAVSFPAPSERHQGDSPHPLIAGDLNKLKKWETAGDDDRFLGQALCELKCRINITGIESYFLFAQTWYERYPKGEKKQYERGMKSVEKGASISPYSAKQVYSILKTIQTYSWDDYTKLASEAASNGVTIKWTHLRIISDRLGKSEHREIRRNVEEQLVSRQMTEALLKQLIDELTHETGESKLQPVKTQVRAFLSTLGRNVKMFKTWKTIIQNLENEFQGDNPREIQTTTGQVQKALEYFDETAAFLAECRPILEMLHGETAHLARHLQTSDPNRHRAVADRITQQTGPGKRPGTGRTCHDRLTLGDGYNEDDTPQLDSLEDHEGDEDESGDDEYQIFGETGNIPEDDGFVSPRRR